MKTKRIFAKGVQYFYRVLRLSQSNVGLRFELILALNNNPIYKKFGTAKEYLVKGVPVPILHQLNSDLWIHHLTKTI